MTSYVVNVNDATTPTNSQGAKQGAEELRAIKLKLQALVAGAFVTTGAAANLADVVTFIQPDPSDRPSMVAGGWLPWNLNQQWGGAPMPFHMIDSATGAEYKFDAFDGYIQDEGNSAGIGNAAGQFYAYQVITPAKNLSLQALWLKMFKTANPVDNLTVQLWTVAAGIPGVLIATAGVINGKQITNDSNGQWYRFSFAVVQALIAGTQYMIVVSKSAGVDAANFYDWKGTTAGTTKYPNNLRGIGTSVPAWTAGNTNSFTFLCEAQTSDQVVQSTGTFTGRIVGSEGTPINRSVGWNKPLREFMPLFHPNGWSILIRGKSWTKDKTIFEAMYGIHHDRINIRSAIGTGFTTVTLYESDNTVNTLVGTSDVSTAIFKDILIVGRSLNDGGDYLKIYTGINNIWTKEIEVIGQSYIFDPLMLKQGTAWIMGGFQLFANTSYTKLSEMTILPSADGWTFITTTGTVEGNVFAISGGKLNQIKAGMAAGGDGFYRKAALGASNANGWAISWKSKIIAGTNTKDENSCEIAMSDGVKLLKIRNAEFFTQDGNASANTYPQINMRSADCVNFFSGKGTDIFHFINGKLVIDGTSVNTGATANNQLDWGDTSVTANENADVLWDYMGYYTTTNIYPQFTSGELHEFAVFSGDKNLLGQAIYNLGVPFSVKQYCGIPRAFISEITQKNELIGITTAPSTASATDVIVPEMESFMLGSELYAYGKSGINNNTASQNAQSFIYMDGSQISGSLGGTTQVGAGGGQVITVAATSRRITNFGLHKVELRYNAVTGGTTSMDSTRRALQLEAKV